MPKIELYISYNQVSLFLSKLKKPFNDWTNKHISQGFSWRKSSVSFQTLFNGDVTITLNLAKKIKIQKNCIRAISVPFLIPKKEIIEIASITDFKQIELPEGNYQVIYQILKKGRKMSYDFTFIQDGEMEPKILVKDKFLKTKADLLMVAKPA